MSFTFEQRGSTWTCTYEGGSWPLTLIGRHVYYGTGRVLTTLTLARSSPNGKLLSILTGQVDLLTATQRKNFSTLSAERLMQASDSKKEDLIAAVSTMLDALLERLLAAQDEIEVFSLTDIKLPKDLTPPYALWPMVPRGRSGMLVGPSGQGKSASALMMAITVATGNKIVDRLEPRAEGPVLYVGQEDDREQWAARATMICKGHSIELPKHLHYLRLKGASLIDSAELLAEIVATKKAVLVVIDSAQATWGSGDDAVREYATRWFNAVEAIGTSVLIVEHPNRGEQKKPDAGGFAAGSSVKRDRTGHAWTLKSIALPPREGEPYRYHVTLTDVKRNNVGKQPDITYEQMIHGYEWMRFVEVEALTASSIVEGSRLDSMIAARLREADDEHEEGVGWSVKELMQVLHQKDDRRIRQALMADYWRPAGWNSEAQFRFVKIPGTGTDRIIDPARFEIEIQKRPVQMSIAPGDDGFFDDDDEGPPMN